MDQSATGSNAAPLPASSLEQGNGAMFPSPAPESFLSGQECTEAGPRSSSSTHGSGSRGGALADAQGVVRETTRTDLNFTDLDLIPAADSARIFTRWMDPFLPPTQKLKKPPAYTIQYSLRVLRSYPRMLLRKGCVPPFIHPLQLATPNPPVPLVNCVSLVRLWESKAAGSEAIVRDTVRREMQRLITEVIIHCFSPRESR
jgi:hypothetical protein